MDGGNNVYVAWVLCPDCNWPFPVESGERVRCQRCGLVWRVRARLVNGELELYLEEV